MTTETDEMVLMPSEGGSRAWADIKAGVHNATLSGIEDAGISQMYPDDGPRYKLEFTLDGMKDENGESVVLRKWVSQKMTTGTMPSNLWKYAEAFGMTPKMGEGFRVRALIGKPCQLYVIVKDTTQGPRPTISNVLPPAAGAAAPTTAEPAADVPMCKVEGCNLPVDKYTPRGTPLCANHTTEDL